MLRTAVVLLLLLSLGACSNTFQGMKRDIREDTSSNDQQTTVVKKTTVVRYQEVPSSPPPLETPPQ